MIFSKVSREGGSSTMAGIKSMREKAGILSFSRGREGKKRENDTEGHSLERGVRKDERGGGGGEKY